MRRLLFCLFATTALMAENLKAEVAFNPDYLVIALGAFMDSCCALTSANFPHDLAN